MNEELSLIDCSQELEELIERFNLGSFIENQKVVRAETISLANDALSLRASIGRALIRKIHFEDFKDRERWINNWLELSNWRSLHNPKLNKLTAIKIFSFFPIFLLAKPPLCPEKLQELYDISYVYQGIASFLWHWEKGISVTDLHQTPWKHLECFALQSESRYKLIRGLFDRGKVNTKIFPTIVFAWIMYESAACRRKNEGTKNKTAIYEHNKEFFDKFSDFEIPFRSYSIKGLEGLAINCDYIFDSLGRQTAQEEIDFDKFYFRPYIEISRRCNAALRKPIFKILHLEEPDPPKRRGPLPGSKRRKDI
jgi:Fe-S-cluster containining protein